jgi:hypothetical protein
MVMPGASQDTDPPSDSEDRRPVQRLALAHYYYGYQGDPRKEVPFRGIRDEDGRTMLTHHPWESIGPWMSYDRAQWHKSQFQSLAAGGIDVVLLHYRGDRQSRADYSLKGLDVMVQGLKELRGDGTTVPTRAREFPHLGLALDLGSVAAAHGVDQVDLTQPETQATLSGMVEDFFRHIPLEFRAIVNRPVESGQAPACILQLVHDAAVSNWDDAFPARLRQHFQKTFGADLVIVGSERLVARAPSLDASAVYPAAHQPAAIQHHGWIRTASLGPGYDDSAQGSGGTIRPRDNGQQTVQDFQTALAENPDWVFIDSWNGYHRGTEIAPTLEHGLLYRDLIRGSIFQFKGAETFAFNILQAGIPSVMQPGHLYQVEVVVQNEGTTDWDSINQASLSYRWIQDGQVVGDRVTPLAARGRHAAGDHRAYLLSITSPLDEGRPMPAGEYQLELTMTRRERNATVRFPAPVGGAYRVPVTVGDAPAQRPYFINSTMPTLVRREAVYPAQVRLRNDGGDTWKAGVHALGYRWLRVPIAADGTAGESVEVVIEGRPAPLTTDVGPGRLVTVEVPVDTTLVPGGSTVTWSPKESWVYMLEWDFHDGQRSAGAGGASTFREVVEILDRDPAPFFLGCSLTSELVAGNTEKVTVGLLNMGPEAWKKERDRVVVHWYYMDGTVASWNDASLPLTEDVAPFSRVEVAVPVRREEGNRRGARTTEAKTEIEVRGTIIREVPVEVPYYFGPMYCVLDFVHDGLHSSTSPSSKGNDILVIPVNVYSPSFTPVPLTAHFNVDGMSQDVDRRDGDIDGRGNTLPAEFMPPFVSRPSPGVLPAPNPLYPSGLWAYPLNDFEGTRVCFFFPPKAKGVPNMVAAQGQRLLLPALPRTYVHVLALSTEEDVSGEFTLYYSDGSSQRQSVKLTYWHDPPKHGERIGFSTPHRHTPLGDDPDTRCYVNHYTLPADGLKTLVALELPRLPAIKVLGVTLEAASLRRN